MTVIIKALLHDTDEVMMIMKTILVLINNNIADYGEANNANDNDYDCYSSYYNGHFSMLTPGIENWITASTQRLISYCPRMQLNELYDRPSF